MSKMTIIETDQLDVLTAEIARLHRRLDQVDMTPKPKWVTINEYAKLKGLSRRTVTRKIEAGKLQVKDMDGERMIGINQEA